VTQLGRGASFGELSLINNAPRIATIIAQRETWLAQLSKTSYNTILGRTQKTELDRKVEFLSSVFLFKNWSRNAILRISYYFKERRCKNK
jgi:hypothetical protein